MERHLHDYIIALDREDWKKWTVQLHKLQQVLTVSKVSKVNVDLYSASS